jgi:hypothetical protein
MNTVSFNAFGSTIINATTAADKAAGKARDIVAQAFAQYMDACTVAGVTRDEEGVKSIGDEVRTCQVFIDAVAVGLIEKNTVTNYAQSAMRAYFHDVAWYASAFLSEEKGGLPALPWSKGAVKGGKARVTKAGTVERTNDKALLDTIRKAIEQAVILNQLEIKSILIDAACVIDPDFKV